MWRTIGFAAALVYGRSQTSAPVIPKEDEVHSTFPCFEKTPVFTGVGRDGQHIQNEIEIKNEAKSPYRIGLDSSDARGLEIETLVQLGRAPVEPARPDPIPIEVSIRVFRGLPGRVAIVLGDPDGIGVAEPKGTLEMQGVAVDDARTAPGLPDLPRVAEGKPYNASSSNLVESLPDQWSERQGTR